jgi:hypothetical protein
MGETHYCQYELGYDDNGDTIECGKVAHFQPSLFNNDKPPYYPAWYCAYHIDYWGHPERNPEDPEYDPNWRDEEDEAL